MVYQQKILRPTMSIIHLDHLIQNVKLLKKEFGENNFFCPMVKANAYGHGDVEVALQLEKIGIKQLGVGLVEEGLLLRQMGCQLDLLVFGTFDKSACLEILKYNLTPVINNWDQLEIIENVARGFTSSLFPLKIHLKFDTGMHRLGFDYKEAEKVFDYIKNKKDLFKVQGIMTHLYSAEDASDPSGRSFEQLRKFLEVENIFAELKPITHVLNSAGLINFIKMKKEHSAGLPGISLNQGVRPGLSVYGYSPLTAEVTGLNLKPVMSLRSHVVRFHELHVGDGTSYGHTWKAGRRSIVGVIPIGYADGYHRVLSNQGYALFQGQKVPVVGNVCMDYLMIDVTDVLKSKRLENIQSRVESNIESDEVTLFGYDKFGNLLSAVEVAQKSKTIPWEVLTSIGERVPRIYEGAIPEKEKLSVDSKYR